MQLKNLNQEELKKLKTKKTKEAESCLNAASCIESADLFLESFIKLNHEIKEIDRFIL